MIGNKRDNLLSGREGSDTIFGGAGQDRLFGGDGADGFIHRHISESHNRTPDLLDADDRDILDLSQIDANSLTPEDDAFTQVEEFSGLAGELLVRFDRALHTTFVEADVNGDGRADMRIEIFGNQEDFSSFIL